MPNDGYGYNGGGAFSMQQPQAPQAQQAPSGRQGPDWGGNFSGNLNDMLAPYQQIAQRISSPYATMSPNSWLAQNHPQLAGTLDNAFLGMGMTPQAQGPEGFGGGVSRMMQGLMGATQQRRQMAMQNMMLPYQMLQPQLQAQDMLAQIGARKSEALREQDYHELVTGRNARMAEQGQADQQRIQIDQQKADQAKYGRLMSSPEERMAYALHPFKDPQNPTPDELRQVSDEYEGIKQGARSSWQSGAGGMQGQLAVAQTPRMTGESDAAWAQRVGQAWTRMGGAAAGAAAGARVGADAPVRQEADTQRFIQEQYQGVQQDVNRQILSKDTFAKLHEFDLISDHDGSKLDSMYDGYMKKTAEPLYAQGRTSFAQYKRSTAPTQGFSYDEWKANPGQFTGSTKSAAPPARSTNAPAATSRGLKFNPTTGKLE